MADCPRARVVLLRVVVVLAAVGAAAGDCNASSWLKNSDDLDAFAKATTQDALACCRLCNTTAKCQYFIHRSDQTTNNCHLKAGTPTKFVPCSACTVGACHGSPPGPTPVPPTPTPPPRPASPGVPNIVLLFPDQWRYDWDTRASSGDLPLHMPTLRALIANGTRFEHAYVASPLCAPSRACIASGREYDATGVPSNGQDYPISQPTFYGQLRQAGYWTMTTGKDDLTKGSQLGSRTGYPGCPECRAGDGLYHQRELGFSDGLRYSGKMDVVDTKTPHEMYGYFLINQTMPGGVTAWDAHVSCIRNQSAARLAAADICNSKTYTDFQYEDDYTAANAIRLLQRRPRSQPFFMHVSFPGPHPPFLITAEMRASVSDGRRWPSAVDDPKAVVPGGLCNASGLPSNAHARCNYAAELENLDVLFKNVIDEIDSQGVRNKTVICVSSDHGTMLGDHGDTDKSKPWQASVSVPLICTGPHIRRNATVKRTVSNMDMAGTFLDLANATRAPGMTTQSLVPLLTGAQTYNRSFVSSGLGNWRMVVQSSVSGSSSGSALKFICCKGTCPGQPSSAPGPKHGFTRLLYDTIADPFDLHDLVDGNPGAAKALAALLPPPFDKNCAGATLPAL